MKKFKNLVLGVFLLGLGLLLYNMDLGETMDQIRSMTKSRLLGLALMQLVTMGLIALQWNSIIGLVGGKMSFSRSLLMNSYGNIVDGITPGAKVGGEISRAYQIGNNFKLSYQEAALVVGLQKTLSILSFLFLYLLSLAYFLISIDGPRRNKLLGLHGLIFLLLLVLIYMARSHRTFLKKLLTKRKIGKAIEVGLASYRKYLSQLVASKKDLAFQLGLGLLIWILYPIKMYLIMEDFNMDLGLPVLVSTTYISYMVAMIPLLPGSIGSFESSLVYLLSFKNILVSKSLAISLIFRFFTFWFEMLVSLVFVGLEKGLNFIRRLKNDKIQT